MPARDARAGIAASLIVAWPLAAGMAAHPAGAAELAYLGPRGTYSEQAAQVYGYRVAGFDTLLPLDSVAAVVAAAASRRVPRAVIPAMIASGPPAETIRALLGALDPGVRVIGEVTIPTDSDLMARSGTKLEDVHAVLSSPGQLAGAQPWLRRSLPGAAVRETPSTGAAAEEVARGDGTLAAVGNPAAADLYRLDVLAHAIQEDRSSRGAFWVIAPAPEPDAIKPFPDATANRAVVTLDAPADSAAFSALVTRFQGIGWRVASVASVPLPGRLYAFRYLVYFAAKQAEPVGRLDDVAQRGAGIGGGKALLTGAWRQQ